MGTVLLMLPLSSALGKATSWIDALFTAVTSVCVTGLVVQNTGTYWSLFGQSIILMLIQIGGLGVITIAVSFSIAAGRKIGLFERSVMQEAVASPNIGGIISFVKFILKFTLICETVGALTLSTVFCREFGIMHGIWLAIFHSISAFCNAGIDLMGIRKPYSSLTAYISDPIVNITIMCLIIIGGIGFLTWDDVKVHGIHVRKYRMQSKVILATTALLILVPAVGFFLIEFQDMPLAERIWSSFFQAVTPRTAGFNTANLTFMSEAGQVMIILLMLIGGAPGSTAGGIKVTTFAVLIACSVAVFRQRNSAQCFGCRIPQKTIFMATTLLLMYIGIAITGAMAISLIEDLPFISCMYETVSAIGTVGLTLGITPELSILSKCILITLMFMGRVGGLTLIYASQSKDPIQAGRLPQGNITVG